MRNEHTFLLNVLPSSFFWDSVNTAAGKPLYVLYVERGSFAVLYLFDFDFSFEDCEGMSKECDALRGRVSKPVEISRGKVTSLLLLIRTVLK